MEPFIGWIKADDKAVTGNSIYRRDDHHGMRHSPIGNTCTRRCGAAILARTSTHQAGPVNLRLSLRVSTPYHVPHCGRAKKQQEQLFLLSVAG